MSARTVPVIASVVLHATVALGLVASVAGHARAGSVSVPMTAEETVDVTVDAEQAVVPLAPALPQVGPKQDAPFPTHTHPYPVDPSHDAHPHDPSLHHDEAAPAPHAHEEAPAATPAAAAPALVATGSALPSFDLSAGSGAPTGAHVAASAAGTGGAGDVAGGADDVVHSASSVQVAARPVHVVVAAYPMHARADEVEGEVALEIIVDREGRVVDARVTHGAGHGFDEAALTAVRGYRFSPAQREGRAVRVRMPWTVQFRLR